MWKTAAGGQIRGSTGITYDTTCFPAFSFFCMHSRVKVRWIMVLSWGSVRVEGVLCLTSTDSIMEGLLGTYYPSRIQ